MLCIRTVTSRCCPLSCIRPIYSRHHSSSFSPPSFHPSGSTSADTNIPYGDPSLASSSYLPSRTASKPSPIADPATSETPIDLSEKEREMLARIIRVDQAGELGANYIYRGQHAVLKRGNDTRVADLVQHMWDGEKKHIAAFDKLVTQHGVRPTLLYPLWKVAGFALGAGTAMLGTRAAMACTEAVETVIGEHYDSQLKALADPTQFSSNHASVPLLRSILAEFRDDELEHLDTAIANESQQAPAHALLSAVIATGCRVAIAATERV